jgi:hypothetical protein
MIVTPHAQSSTSISVSWMAEAGDPVLQPGSITVSEYDAKGNLRTTKTNFTVDGGPALFTGLMPGTTYNYTLSASISTESGFAPFGPIGPCPCATPSPAGKQPDTPSTPSQPPGPSSPGQQGSFKGYDYSGAVKNVQALAKPFGKIVVTWSNTGEMANTLVLQRSQQIAPTESSGNVTVYQIANYQSTLYTPDKSGIDGTFVDSGPFVLSAVYNYIFTSDNGQSKAYAIPPSITYPAVFGLSKFLPPGFDPSQGIKRLRPSDHPTISVRSIMTGT